jgi:trk system potassium uptake protein TrkA
VVVIGADRLGRAVTRWLVSAGHEIAVVDSDQERCAAVDEAFGSVSVIGDCVDWAVLSRAGANRADAVIATSNDDSVNLIACQIAKHRFEVTATISVVNHSDHVDLFNSLGVDVTVDAPDLMLNQIQEGLTSQQITHLKPLPANGQDRSLVSIRIPREYGSENRRLDSLSFPEGTLLSLVITRDGEPHLPTNDLKVRAGDEIVAVTTAKGEDELRDLLSNDWAT